MNSQTQDGSYEHYSSLIDILEKKIADLQSEAETLKRLRAKTSGIPEGERRLDTLHMVEVVMKKRGKPMHTIDETAPAIFREFGVMVNKATLGTKLHRAAVNRKKTFFKDPKQPNTYGLREWQEGKGSNAK